MTTTYLTKIDGDQVFHFRVVLEPNGISIIEGHVYHYLRRLFQGIGLPASRVSEQDKRKVATMAEEMVQRQIAEGYQVTPFVETKENTVEVYDNARFHYEGNFPEDLDRKQAYVHTGVFLGWLIDRALINPAFFGGFESALTAYRQREMTGAELFANVLDGKLGIEALSEQGNKFALQYFDFRTGQYLHDYRANLAMDCLSVYHVADNWENYARLKTVLDIRYQAWCDQVMPVPVPVAPVAQAPDRQRPWWKFW